MDLDGTLVFHEKIHGIKKISDTHVKDPLENSIHKAYDISLNDYSIYFDKKTRDLGKMLSKDYTIIFVTGARRSTLDTRLHVMDFADYYILENGGLIFDKSLNEDYTWSNMLVNEKKELEKIKHQLTSEGFVLDDKGRTVATRIRQKDNPSLSDSDFNNFYNSLVLPRDLKKTMNTGHIDIILKSSGKENAVRYLYEKLGYEKNQTYGIGDDINDILFLEQLANPFVLKSAYPETLEKARENNWYISKANHFNGINEIFEKLLKMD